MHNKSIFTVGFSLLLAVSLLLVQFIMSSRLTNLDQTMNSLQEKVAQLEAENADLRQQLDTPPLTGDSPGALLEGVTTAIPTLKTLNYLGMFLVIFLAGAGLLTLYLNSLYQNQADRDRRSEAERLQKQAYQKGFTEAARRLVTKSDVLSNLVRWLAQYDRRVANVDDAALLQRQLLKHLASIYELQPVADVGKITPFVPSEQQTYDHISTGDKVVVVKPGWQLAGQIIDQPVVSRVAKQH